jgi:hypothetical protein
MRPSAPMISSHTLSLVFICVALMFVQVIGVHGHISIDHKEHLASSAHEHVDAYHGHAAAAIVSSHDVVHELTHLSHGELDVDPPLSLAGKVPSISFVALVCALLSLWLRPHRKILSDFAEPTARRMWRRYFLPLSHAPPTAR